MKKAKIKTKIRLAREDRILFTVSYIILGLLLITIMYPLIYVVSSSFSSGEAVSAGRVIFWPVDFSLQGYKIVFNYEIVWIGYANTIFYTVVGTCLNLVLTTLAAYPLSRRDFHGKGVYMILFMITMFFSGGMIPSYILMSNLGLVNTRWAILLSGAISVYNMIVMRTFFMNSIPDELREAAVIDGVDDIGYLTRIVLPLSKAVISVITMYYAVGHWNSYFSAMLYLRKRELQPLQIVLRDILNASKFDPTEITDPELAVALVGSADLLKYSLIVVSTVPILCVYPFIQKYFEKGVMIGSVKG